MIIFMVRALAFAEYESEEGGEGRHTSVKESEFIILLIIKKPHCGIFVYFSCAATTTKWRHLSRFFSSVRVTHSSHYNLMWLFIETHSRCLAQNALILNENVNLFALI